IEKTARSFKRLIQLTISGGEPYLRDDLPEIVRAFVRECSVRFVTLTTNAFLPDRVIPATERILAENPRTRFNFCVSIDDIGVRHDAIRGVSGGFERLMETYRGAVDLRRRFGNMEIHTTTVLSALNKERILEVLDWIDGNLDAEIPEVLLVRGSPRDPAAAGVELETYEAAVRKIGEMSRRRAKTAGFKNRLITSLSSWMSELLVTSEREKKMVVPCVAGGKLVIIRADGTVDPCEILDTLVPPDKRPEGLENFSFGSLRENEYCIDNIHYSEKAERVRRFIKKTKCHCTFECALFASVIFNPACWPRLGARVMKDWILPRS
ncbi:MAG: SPASM domain-containing protein, partial [Chitinispirillaceae bacterium]|nr:SPASM domain-containing protein [Chitinispirillaceae bacterium]